MLPLIRVGAAKGCGSIDQDVGVVNDTGDGRANLHGADIVRLLKRIGQNEIAKRIRSGSGQSVGVFHSQNQIGGAILPGLAVRGRHRRSRRITQLHTGLNPPGNERYLRIAKPSLVCKIAKALLWQPWWHISRRSDRSHLLAPTASVLISQQAERAGAARMVTGGAVVVYEGSYVGSPRNRVLRLCAGMKHTRCDC